MNNITMIDQKVDIRLLDDAEIDCVAGGFGPGVDMTGMPNWDQMCGTMWYLQHILKGAGLPRL